jgi:bacteriorhodopsin
VLPARQVRHLHTASHWNTQAVEAWVLLLEYLVLLWFFYHTSFGPAAGADAMAQATPTIMLYTALPAVIPGIVGLPLFLFRENCVRSVM